MRYGFLLILATSLALLSCGSVSDDREFLVDEDSDSPASSDQGGEVVSAPTSNTTPQTGGTMGQLNDFLWKPEAESNYNPGGLVIHAGPCRSKVVVNGTGLKDYGPGNGRCITARHSRTGCAWGNNVRVEVIDIPSGRPYTHNGQPYITVPRGCDRFEFKR